MKEQNMLDAPKNRINNAYLWTNLLLLVSIFTTIFIIVVISLNNSLQFRRESLVILYPVCVLLAFVSSIVGFIVGFYERKKNKRQALFGIIGNLIVMLFYLIGLILLVNMARSFGSH